MRRYDDMHSAPTGRNGKAQGAALGTPPRFARSPNGAKSASGIGNIGYFAPLGLRNLHSQFPGLRPGLFHCAPLGLKYRQILVVVALCFAAGCTSQSNGQAVKVEPPKDGALSIVQPRKQTLHRSIELPGTLEAYEETPMLARIAGHVGKVHVDAGDSIREGQVLAEQSVPEMNEELKQKQALVSQAAAEVDQAAASLEAAEAYIQTAKALVREAEAGRTRAQENYNFRESEYKNAEKLVKQDVINVQTLDVTRYQFKAADAAREEIAAKVFSAQATARESEAKRNKAKADVEAAKARVRVAEAEQGRLAALVAYAKIRAPYDGVVVKRNIHTGHFLQPSGAATTPLFVVARIDQVRIVVEVPEADALLLPPETPAKVRIQSLKDRVFEGKVNRTSWSLETKTRTMRVQVDLANRKDQPLRPGMYAFVAFTVEFPQRLVVPATAVGAQGDQAYCFFAKDGKAKQTPIKIGLRDGQWVEVLSWQKKDAGQTTWQAFSGTEHLVEGNLANVSDGMAISSARNE